MFGRLCNSEGTFWNDCVPLSHKLILGCLFPDAQAGLVGGQLDLGQTQAVTAAAVVSGEAPPSFGLHLATIFVLCSSVCGGTWRRVSLPRGDGA